MTCLSRYVLKNSRLCSIALYVWSSGVCALPSFGLSHKPVVAWRCSSWVGSCIAAPCVSSVVLCCHGAAGKVCFKLRKQTSETTQFLKLFICAKFVLCTLTDEQKEHRVNDCEYEFDVGRSVHDHTIQINEPTRCNSFTSLLLDVYVSLNMFRAPPRPSSGAYNCINSLWFYLGTWW